jgi:2-polyprenyl-3-methyl-5-hydroxy-6-metoxy-1,4-benzoquinol methylase
MVSTPPRLTGVAERMDAPGLDARELAEALRTLARINRLFGATRVVLHHLPRLCDPLPGPVRILDVGTGYADIPRAIVRWARRRGRRVAITALDRNPATLGAAARACADYPEIRLLRGDALALPFRSNGFDVALASQILHHMEAAEPVRLLSELRRVARQGLLVHDLRRGTWPYTVTRLALHALSRSSVIRHDGPVSIRRGYLPAELQALARAAGWGAPRVARHAFFHLALVEENP